MSFSKSIVDQVISSGTPGSEKQASADQRKTNHYVAGRNTMLADLADGSIRHQEQRLVDPAECRPWPGNPRVSLLLNETNCADLIEAIRAEGRQQVPAIVRPIKEGPERYEIIAGVRRHFAISWLRNQNFAEYRFLVEVRDLSDEEAFRISDSENRGRRDISDYERAKSYLTGLSTFYQGNQARMAERLRVSSTTLSRLLNLARLPEEVIAAVADPRQLTVNMVAPLTPLLGSPPVARAIIEQAKAIAAEQQQRLEDGQPRLSAGAVIAALRSAVTMRRSSTPTIQEFRTAAGDLVATVKRGRGGSGQIIVAPSRGAAADERRALLLAAVDALS